MSQSDRQHFGWLVLSLYMQGTLLEAGTPVAMEIITLECQKFMFVGGGFMTHASSFH